MLEQAVVACFSILSQHSPRRNQEKQMEPVLIIFLTTLLKDHEIIYYLKCFITREYIKFKTVLIR